MSVGKYRIDVYDHDGNLIATPTEAVVTSFLSGASGGTFSPYDDRAMRLIVTDADGNPIASYRAMTPDEYREWERENREWSM